MFRSEKLQSQFTNEIFTIVKIATCNSPNFNLCGEQGDEILSKFSEQ